MARRSWLASAVTAFRSNDGWKVVASAGSLQFLISALFLQSYGVYVVVMHRDMGWSLTMLSAGFSLARTESALLGPLQGHMIDRFGPRAMTRNGVLAFAAGFVALSMVQSPVQFFGAMFAIAVGASFAGPLTANVAVVRWFTERRATAIGITATGFALGGIAVPAVGAALEALTWRPVAVGTGVIMLAAGLVLVRGIHDRPPSPVTGMPPAPRSDFARGADHRERLDESSTEDEAAPTPTAEPQSDDFTARKALHTSAFWFLSIGHACAVALVSSLIVHLVPHLTATIGLSLGVAGAVVAGMTTMQVAGMVIGGVLGDRMSKKVLASAGMATHAVSIALLAVTDHVGLIVLAVLFHGFAWGVRGPLQQAWRADLFGTRHFGAIMGYSSVLVLLGSAGGPLLAGYLYDRLGSYEAAFLTMSGVAVVGVLLFAAVRPPQSPSA